MALEIRRPISVKGEYPAEPMIPDVSTATGTNSKYATILDGQILQDVFESNLTSDVDSVAECWTALRHEPITTDKQPFKRYWSTAVNEALFCALKVDTPGLLSNQMAFIHLRVVSALVDFPQTSR